MKWIIFASSDQPAELKDISAFFSEQKTQYGVFDIASLAERHTDSDDLKNFRSVLDKATHCIILYTEEMASIPPLMFAAGYFEGKDIPVFMTGFKAKEKIPYYLQHVHNFSDVKKMLAEMGEKFEYYLKEEEKKTALKKLFEAGIPFNPDSFAFHIAKNNLRECALFVTGGMDINSRDSAGTPMICIAARSEKKEMITWLIKNGADINAVSQDRGYSAVMDAVWRSNNEITELFVSLGADLQLISRDGQPILVLSVGNGNIRICELLIKNGADPHIKDRMGMSAYQYAALFKKDAIIALFDEYKK